MKLLITKIKKNKIGLWETVEVWNSWNRLIYNTALLILFLLLSITDHFYAWVRDSHAPNFV